MGLQDFFMGQPQQTIDPYAQSRQQNSGLQAQFGQQYNRMQQTPYLDPEMMRYLDTAASEKVRSSNPQAGRSGYLDQKVWDAQLQNRMAALDRAMKERSDMRNSMVQLSGQGAQMPTQQQPRQIGALESAGGEMFQKAGLGLLDSLGKAAGQIDFSKIFGGSPTGGMGVNPNEPGQSTNGWETGWSNQ